MSRKKMPKASKPKAQEFAELPKSTTRTLPHSASPSAGAAAAKARLGGAGGNLVLPPLVHGARGGDDDDRGDDDDDDKGTLPLQTAHCHSYIHTCIHAYIHTQGLGRFSFRHLKETLGLLFGLCL